jgi:hypothetical protein
MWFRGVIETQPSPSARAPSESQAEVRARLRQRRAETAAHPLQLSCPLDASFIMRPLEKGKQTDTRYAVDAGRCIGGRREQDAGLRDW